MRLIYLDLVRLFACLCILTIHFNASVSGFDFSGKFLYPNGIIPNHFFNGVYLGDIGVGLFFILSGASLEHTNKEVNITELKLFYYKRAKSLYPLFWTAFILATILTFNKDVLQLPKWHLLVSFAGLDGYVMALGGTAGSFYKVGEWFLGCIICLYISYPFLAYFLHKYPILTSLLSLASYAYLIKIISPIWFFLQIPYFILGMCFIRYWKTAKNPKLWMGTILLIVLRLLYANELAPWTIAIITNWTLFLIIVFATENISITSNHITDKISHYSDLTYPIFLVHHILISKIASKLDLQSIQYWKIVILYILYITLTIAMAKLLRKVVGLFGRLCK